jgi:hypothetical protein
MRSKVRSDEVGVGSDEEQSDELGAIGLCVVSF